MTTELSPHPESSPTWITHTYTPESHAAPLERPAFIARDPGAAAYLRPVLRYFVQHNAPFALFTKESALSLTDIPQLSAEPVDATRISIALTPGDHDPAQTIVPMLQNLKQKNPALKIAVAEDYPSSTQPLLQSMAANHLLPSAILSNSRLTQHENVAFLHSHGLSTDSVPCIVTPNPAFDEHHLTDPKGNARKILHIPAKTFLLGIFGMPEQDIPAKNNHADHNTYMMQTIRTWLQKYQAPISIIYQAHRRSETNVHQMLKGLPSPISVYQYPRSRWDNLGLDTPAIWPDCTAVIMGRSTLGQELALARDLCKSRLPIPIETIMEREYGKIPHDRTAASVGGIAHASSARELTTLLTRVTKDPTKEDLLLRRNQGAFINHEGWLYAGLPIIMGVLNRLSNKPLDTFHENILL